ncbi:MAG TPA: 50S ribosomal protein L13 [Firmicutes bacterium]|nr:50S ribosomal protein L13 [Candidatus Fermentithermobacillaceae bacterium]
MRGTYMARPGEVERKWWIIDAKGKPLGRLASTVALILRGKHKPEFTPSVDMGDSVIVLNAGSFVLTGKKPEQKIFFRHSGYPGGARYIPYKKLMKSNPEILIRTAVKGMLPHNRLGRKLLKRLFVYRGSNHPHEAQRPAVWQG